MKLELKDITFSYKTYNSTQKNRVLYNNLSLLVKEKEKVLILSPPENGKTTLSSIITRIIPRFKEGSLTGQILINDIDVTEIEPYNTTELISLVPQNSAEFIINSNVEEEIVFPMENANLDRKTMKEKLEKAAKKWGLSKLLSSDTHELSGGEKRRLCLAVNDVQDSKINIYDESFDDLDNNYKEVLKDKIKNDNKTSIVFASRFIKHYENLFDTIYLLENQELKKIEEKEINELFSLNKFSFQKTEKSLKESLTVNNLSFKRVKNNKEKEEFTIKVENFEIYKNEIVTLEGLNGSGKTTFSYILTGLREKESGIIKLNNKEINSNELLLNVGYIFQNPDYQLFLPTVKDELLYSLDKTNLTKEEKEKEIEKLCSLFKLNPDENSLLMSFGKRKFLQAAIYYSLNRPYYILDELESAISYEDAILIINLLRERGAGILVITHDEKFSKLIRNRGYRIVDGVMYEN